MPAATIRAGYLRRSDNIQPCYFAASFPFCSTHYVLRAIDLSSIQTLYKAAVFNLF